MGKVESSFITYRSSQGVTDTFFGRHEHCIVERAGQLRIEEKRTILDMEALRPQGGRGACGLGVRDA